MWLRGSVLSQFSLKHLRLPSYPSSETNSWATETTPGRRRFNTKARSDNSNLQETVNIDFLHGLSGTFLSIICHEHKPQRPLNIKDRPAIPLPRADLEGIIGEMPPDPRHKSHSVWSKVCPAIMNPAYISLECKWAKSFMAGCCPRVHAFMSRAKGPLPLPTTPLSSAQQSSPPR
ncbi:hypothetical protein FDENT_13299 [Fusarium denticulatum]|uniref:Uncharacterized protein n=1 Tax=Fusarium denticulatum TaxID=48507 RepID=A0A8H5WJW2_9HYPO|nr:hypothetical protein FDENT_13299 [Fusarium denticulatum]